MKKYETVQKKAFVLAINGKPGRVIYWSEETVNEALKKCLNCGMKNVEILEVTTTVRQYTQEYHAAMSQAIYDTLMLLLNSRHK